MSYVKIHGTRDWNTKKISKYRNLQTTRDLRSFN